MSTAVQAIALARDLRDKAAVYAALAEPEHSMWGSCGEDARKFLRELQLFGTTQWFPVLLATLECNKSNFLEILRLISFFTFRYSIISKGSPGDLEAAYGQICRIIQEGRVKRPRTIFKNHLAHLYPDDSRFEDSFAGIEFPPNRNRLSRYLLASIERHIVNDKEHTADPNLLTLEHILPRNPDPEWNKLWSKSGENMEDYINRLGNLTLLLKKPGRDAGNASFDEKSKAIYTSSKLEITKALLKVKQWGPDEITSRQKRLAGCAKTIWRLSYQ